MVVEISLILPYKDTKKEGVELIDKSDISRKTFQKRTKLCRNLEKERSEKTIFYFK